MSINVRRQLFLQKLQRVLSLRVVRYSILRTASRPTNDVCSPLRHKRRDSAAAPIAPDSPQNSCTMISGFLPAARKLLLMKSTSAFTTAMLFCVPPCSTKRVPSAARFGMLATYRNTFLGSTAARPARISSALQPCRWKLTMSDCMNTAHPYPKTGMDLAEKARSAYCSTPNPKPSAVDCKKYPLPAEHCVLSLKSFTLPL